VSFCLNLYLLDILLLPFYYVFMLIVLFVY